jgi:hypothetical protein
MGITVDFSYANIHTIQRMTGIDGTALFTPHPGLHGTVFLSMDHLIQDYRRVLEDESLSLTDKKLQRHNLWDLYCQILSILSSAYPGETLRPDAPYKPYCHSFRETAKLLCWSWLLGHELFITSCGPWKLDRNTRTALGILLYLPIVTGDEIGGWRSERPIRQASNLYR